jgi:proline iminopeptidase
MATTLPAPPEWVWPWLVQLGGDRGGWYSWDWLDNNGERSTDRIVPEWQCLQEGQHLYKAPNGPSRFTVAVLELNRTLVLRSDYSKYVDGIWGFHLRPAPGDRTRLVVRTRSRGPRLFSQPFGLLLGEPLHFALQTLQFRNLRTRVVMTSCAPRSATTSGASTGSTPSSAHDPAPCSPAPVP